MASSSGPRGTERMIHQDFIARIRFSNTLPPPAIPPKLLEIPSTGLSGGQYTTPGFASRLAREQALNIEADAELGMPLDLVGMPGVFDGDERSIQAPAQPPALHPRDRALLRPLSTLGRPKVAETAVSFLRRTEYISSATPKRMSGPPSRALLSRPKRGPEKRSGPDPNKDSPQAIKRRIDDSFAAAARLLQDPAKVRHPSRRDVRVVEALPLLPNLEAFPDSGAYVTVKFLFNPLPSSSTYDGRMLSGLLRPCDRSAAEEAAMAAAQEAHERNPGLNPKPTNLMNYEFYLPPSASAARRFQEKIDVNNPDRDRIELYTHRGGGDGEEAEEVDKDDDGDDSAPCFQFTRLRAYETAAETELDHSSKYAEELILSFEHEHEHGDEEDEDENAGRTQQRVAYYYPVMQRSAIRPQRMKNIARKIGLPADREEQCIDQLDVTVEQPRAEMRAQMRAHRENPRAGLVVAAGADDVAAIGGGDADADAEADVNEDDADADADGDDDT